MPELSQQDWAILRGGLFGKKLTPIIGDQVFSSCLPTAAELVRAWKHSEDVKYPYKAHPSIGRLARYVSVRTRDPRLAYLLFIKEHLQENSAQAPPIPDDVFYKSSVTEIAERLGRLDAQSEHSSALHALANLSLPLYITTSYFTVLERELEKTGKVPESAICYWRRDLKPGIEIDESENGRLLKLLRRSFNKEEVKNLAFEVFGSSFDDLPDEGFGSLHREVILKAKRENMLGELLRTAKEDKPRPEWGSLMEALGLDDHEDEVSRVPSVFQNEPDYWPSPQRPLVFHLYGIDSYPASLVLTEDDYIDFLMFVSRENDALPAPVTRALSNTSIVMLGYELHEWEFIVLFRGLIASRRRQRSEINICLQQLLTGENSGIVSDGRQEVESYLDRYLDRAEFSIYWGPPEDFLGRLQGD